MPTPSLKILGPIEAGRDVWVSKLPGFLTTIKADAEIELPCGQIGMEASGVTGKMVLVFIPLKSTYGSIEIKE